MEDLSFPVGPMSVRLESIHAEPSPANYVSFLHQSRKPCRGRSDTGSIHSVSSVRSVMSGMSAFWSNLGLSSSSASKSEKAKLAAEADLKYLYSAFTKIPCLRLAPDHRARLIRGYEEFPFDTAVPLHAFKNAQGLEIIDVDFRQFFGWDKVSEQIVYLTVKRAKLDDPGDLLTGLVLEDADRRKRRSTKQHGSSTITWIMPSPKKVGVTRSNSDPGTPPDDKYATSVSPKQDSLGKEGDDVGNSISHPSGGSSSPGRPNIARPTSSYRNIRGSSKMKRSSSGSSNSSDQSLGPQRSGSTSTLPLMSALSPSKWRRLKFLSLADNSLTSLSVESLAPVAGSLRSLDLSSNLFTEIPDSLASLIALQSLDLSNCMIESLHSLIKNPLPAITRLKLRSNRLRSIAGVERLLSLECLNLQDNRISDPTEMARLTGIPNLREIWVKHNPLTKSHGNYRVTIFNLFRRAPTGYTDDIVIDNACPGYSERKQLVERVVEPEHPPGLRSLNITEHSTDQESHQVITRNASQSKRSTDPTASSIQPSHQPQVPSIQNGYYNVSTRRRKGPRRRIIDISKEETTTVLSSVKRASVEEPPVQEPSTQEPPVQEPPAQEPPAQEPSAQEALPNLTPELSLGSRDESKAPDFDQRPNANNSPASVKSERLLPSSQTGRDRNVSGQDYRKKIEALKNEVGSNWLSILGEHSFDGASDSLTQNNGPMTPHITPSLHSNNSQPILSSGRSFT